MVVSTLLQQKLIMNNSQIIQLLLRQNQERIINLVFSTHNYMVIIKVSHLLVL